MLKYNSSDEICEVLSRFKAEAEQQSGFESNYFGVIIERVNMIIFFFLFFFLIHYSRAGLTYGEAMGRALKA